MSDLPRRPKTIWITQILLIIIGLPYSLIAIFGILRAVLLLIEVETSEEALSIYLGILLNIGMILAFAYAFWGLVQRRRYGRWLSVVIVLLLVGAGVLGQFYRPQGPIGYYEYENENQRMGGIFATILMVGLFGFWLYRLVFGESVSDFFNAEPPDTQLDTPPPPDQYFGNVDTNATNQGGTNF